MKGIAPSRKECSAGGKAQQAARRTAAAKEARAKTLRGKIAAQIETGETAKLASQTSLPPATHQAQPPPLPVIPGSDADLLRQAMECGVDWSKWGGFTSYIPNSVFATLIKQRSRVVLLVSGNQLGKSYALVRVVCYRVMGMCPYPDHNIKPGDQHRVIRLAAETLPGDVEGEVRNTLYPALKHMMPGDRFMKDITTRTPVMTVQPMMGGKPAQLEFVSYNQSSQAMAGVQRRMILADEVPPQSFHEESMPRLAATNGQIFYGMTPEDAGWTYDELYLKARAYYRTPAVRAFLRQLTGQNVPPVERTDSAQDISVIQAASDDGPIYKVMLEERQAEIKAGIITKADFPYETVSDYLDSIYMFDDPSTTAMRRYGVFREASGAVHKEFSWLVHVIPAQKYFIDGIPETWKCARMIDYHQSTPWAVVLIAISPEDECFVFNEFNPDPHSWTTLSIAKELAAISGERKFSINLIDPLAGQKQTNTNTSVIEDFNRIFYEMKRSGLCASALWEPWDTKGTKGQDKVRERLINAKICGKPFNNLQRVEGREVRLPTLFITDNCRQMALSLKNWRMEEWQSREAQYTKDKKDKVQQKWSHFNTALEAIMKDARFSPQHHEWLSNRRESPPKRYFQSGMRA